jgi:hypothetical protein
VANAAGGGYPTIQDVAWEEQERALRRQEVTSARRSVWAQIAISVVAFTATMIAAYAAYQAAEAVDQAADGTERQADEARLSTAVSSIGAERAAERIAGLTLLGDHVESTIADAETDEARLEASRLHTVALDIVENYLRHPPDPTASTATTGPTPPRHRNNPGPAPDGIYAAQELRELLDMWSDWDTRGDAPTPGLDLANVQLDGVAGWAGRASQPGVAPVPGIDLSWLDGHWFVGIDLRGANLQRTTWGTAESPPSSLKDAHLQCTDLVEAQLVGVNLAGADLRGADLSRANLRGANLTGTDLRQTNLNGADLSGATLTDARLQGAVANETIREGTIDVDQPAGAHATWTRAASAPTRTWRGNPVENSVERCLDEYTGR